MKGQKQEGFIVRRKLEKQVQSSPSRSRSQDQTLTNHTTLTDFGKTPGEIKKLIREQISIGKIDEEVYYNSDVYFKYQRAKRPLVNYEQSMHEAIQVRKMPEKREQASISRMTQQMTVQKTVYSEKPLFSNIHSSFELDKFHQIYHLLINIITSMHINKVETLKSIKAYIRFVSKENIDNVNHLKFVPNKRQLLKQSFAAQREAIIALCFIIAIDRFQNMKHYCSNLLNYALENFLLALSLLTQQKNEYVTKLLKEHQKEHLTGKGFESMRTTTELMTSLIMKIAKNDPLFAGQFCKIVQNYSTHSVKAELYSVLSFFAFYLHATKNVQKVPFLAAAPGPYILDAAALQFTLVIDFVKIFTDNSIPLRRQIKRGNFPLRPYSQYFLGEMSKYFQIISFSDYMPIQCNKVISRIDEKRCVKHKLFKFHIDCYIKKKEAEKIGRDSDRVILLDSTQSLKTDNLMLINAWKGESSDAVLAQICPLLAMIAVKRLSVIQSLRKIKQTAAKNASLGLRYINCSLNL